MASQSSSVQGKDNETSTSLHDEATSPESPINPPQPNKETSSLVIIGIDFGATSSAAAFALANRNSNKHEPKILNQWPAAVRRCVDSIPREQQIPSTIYYNGMEEIVGWGEDEYEAIGPNGYQRSGLRRVEDFKTQLVPPRDMRSEEIEHKRLILPPGKSIEDVNADYLRNLRESICSQIDDQIGSESGNAQGCLRYVITVPAFWDEDAREKLRAIAHTAGFSTKSDDGLALISGPEAAVLYADSIDSSAFEVGDNILVADCGGHIVETVTYEVESKNPLRLQQCTSASAASCGSAEVTRRFISIANSKIQKMGLSDLPQAKAKLRMRCRMNFERQVKLALGRDDFQTPPDLPRGFWGADMYVEFEVPEADLVDGFMIFSEEEIYSCFNPCVDRTLELIEEQITAVRAQNKRVQSCLLVGGFNKCAYYSQKVQSGVQSHELRIIRPENDSVGFAIGAVLAGLQYFDR